MRTRAIVVGGFLLVALTGCTKKPAYPGFQSVGATPNGEYYMDIKSVHETDDMVYLTALLESPDRKSHSVFLLSTNCEGKMLRGEGSEYTAEGRFVRNIPKDSEPIAVTPEIQNLVSKGCQIAAASRPPLPAVGAALKDALRKKPQVYPFEVLNIPEVKVVVSRVFGQNISLMEERSQTQVPLVKEGNSVLLSGCKAHFCPNEGASVVIDLSTGKAAGAMFDDEKLDIYLGDYSQIDVLPKQLKDWVQENSRKFDGSQRLVEIANSAASTPATTVARPIEPAALPDGTLAGVTSGASNTANATNLGSSTVVNAAMTKDSQQGGTVSNSPLELQLHVNKSTWLSVQADGRPEVAETLRDSTTKTVTARERIVLTTGNPVDVTCNGKPLGILGSYNQRSKFTIIEDCTVN